MLFIHAILLGIIEGVTEFLPISSTGHLILAEKLLGILQTDFVKSFDIIIQLGAIVAVVVLYWKTIIEKRKLWPVLLAGFIPTALIGLVGYSFIKHALLGNSLVVILSLLLGGFIFIVLEFVWKKKKFSISSIDTITIPEAIGVGLIQSLSVIPGVSRSASTILGGMFFGLSRVAAVEFSFLLSIPTMMAATGYDIVKNSFSFSQQEILMLIVGFTVSFIFALLAIKTFIRFIQKHTFVIFGIYRIIVAILFWVFILRGN